MRLWLAFQCFFLVLFARRLPAGAVALLPARPDDKPSLPPREAEIVATKPKAAEPVTVAPDGLQAVQLLQILQREGRLLDFLQEDVDAYSDAQIGAAVRDIHRGCKKALAEHLPVEPVLRDAENAQVRVDVGFDPSRIRLVGNVVGEPPFVGALKHHGWRVGKVALPSPARGSDPSVVTPAEVELS
ncbi:MAG TPA: DUF2760 domain-containing protein [Polyangia bacterium]|jgi:hypothetical protein|nr:DUF2760 domain-containing protein [Polyangia bacterium]